MVDINKAIKLAVTTGKATFGFKETLEALRGGKAKLIIYANNMPDERKKQLQTLSKSYKIPLLQYKSSSNDLGAECGKPFNVSVLAVREPGDSDILKMIEQR